MERSRQRPSRRTRATIVAIVASACVTCDPRPPIAPVSPPATTAAASPCPSLADDFEGDALAPFWLPGDYGEGLYAPGAVRTSDRYARSGRRSVEVAVHQGDIAQAGDGDTQGRKPGRS